MVSTTRREGGSNDEKCARAGAWTIIAANNGFFHQEYFEEQIARAIRETIDDCAVVASRINHDDPYALHPDIAYQDMDESARVAAHSMAQAIAGAIRNLKG
jgi:hypothetical protein